MKKIRDFFKVQSNYQLFIINIVFALTGVSSVFVADYILDIFLVNRIDYGDFLVLANKNYLNASNISNSINNIWYDIWRICIFLGYGEKNFKKTRYIF